MDKILGWVENAFETMLFNFRLITLAAVLSSLVASVIMFAKGAFLVAKGAVVFSQEAASLDAVTHETVIVPLLVESVDNFLFATVLLVFSMGLYELFISKIDPASRTGDSRPNWLKISSLDDLKGAVAKVILMILIVSFLEKSMRIEYKSAMDLLFLSGGIILIAGSLFLNHKGINNSKINQNDIENGDE